MSDISCVGGGAGVPKLGLGPGRWVAPADPRQPLESKAHAAVASRAMASTVVGSVAALFPARSHIRGRIISAQGVRAEPGDFPLSVRLVRPLSLLPLALVGA